MTIQLALKGEEHYSIAFKRCLEVVIEYTRIGCYCEVTVLVVTQTCTTKHNEVVPLMNPATLEYITQHITASSGSKGLLHVAHTHVCKQFLTTVIGLVLGLFVLYNSLPWLTAGLRGCAYYQQRLTFVTVSLIHTLSSCH